MNQEHAASICEPRIGKIAVISVTGTSGRTNLAAAAQLGVNADQSDPIQRGRFITLQADGADVYFFFNNSDAGTADETATTGNDRTWTLKAGIPQDFILRDGYTWLVHKGASNTKLRAYVSSYSPTRGE